MTAPTGSILVIDDEDSICLAFRRFFEPRGWQVTTKPTAGAGRQAFFELRPDLVFLDVRLPDASGLDLLAELADAKANVVVITAYGGLDTAVRALHGQACEYLVKPIDLDRALSLAERILASRAAQTAESGTSGGELLIGKSPLMQAIYKQIARAAGGAMPVLITGETGTGKELVARAIHSFSDRRDQPFLAVNGGAIPADLVESELFGHVRGAFTGAGEERAGRFEAAHGGTLLLDEVGELPLPAQVKLLRVLDSGMIERVGSNQSVPVDVRILAATNRDLSEEIAAGRFRRDLFYRLAVLQIDLPPLRQREGDVELLARHFLAGQLASLSDEALALLVRHDWPGNVRELKNAMDHATAVAPDRAIRPEDLPSGITGAPPRGDDLASAVLAAMETGPNGKPRYAYLVEQIERIVIGHALKHCPTQSDAADYLGLHRNTLRNKIRELNLEH